MPGNIIRGLPPTSNILAPMARKSFLLASTLLEMMCQCPMVTPVALNGAGCAAAPPAINVDASNNAANILVFMTISLLDDSGLVVWTLATRTLSGRLKARKLGTRYGHPRFCDLRWDQVEPLTFAFGGGL